ncbi:MAG: hypothetical protein ACYC1U_01570 [Candidatus Aquicultorales bacterium]
MQTRPIEFTIIERCPSIRELPVDVKLKEWRLRYRQMLQGKELIDRSIVSGDEAVRRYLLEHWDGPFNLSIEFHLRGEGPAADMDEMASFVIACFRTEETEEAAKLEKESGSRPWYYYQTLGFPGDVDVRRVIFRRFDGMVEDLTKIRLEPPGTLLY